MSLPVSVSAWYYRATHLSSGSVLLAKGRIQQVVKMLKYKARGHKMASVWKLQKSREFLKISVWFRK